MISEQSLTIMAIKAELFDLQFHNCDEEEPCTGCVRAATLWSLLQEARDKAKEKE